MVHSRCHTSSGMSAAVRMSRSKRPERLAEAGIESSVGSSGDSYDNPVPSEVDVALAETINGLYKAVLSLAEGGEVIHR